MNSKLYMIKVGTLYVKSAFRSFGDIDFTDRPHYAKQLNEEAKDFVLRHFPDAQVREFDVVEAKGW